MSSCVARQNGVSPQRLSSIARVVDRYGTDVLAAGRRKPRSTERPAEPGMVVEDVQTGYVGAVVRVEYGRIDLEDRHGHTRGFPLGPGYLLEGRPVILTAPRRVAPAAATRTASGSVAVHRCSRPGRPRQPDLCRGPP